MLMVGMRATKDTNLAILVEMRLLSFNWLKCSNIYFQSATALLLSITDLHTHGKSF